MEEKDWENYVKKVTGGAFPVPGNMVSDVNDWTCRSTVGRVLFFLDDIEGAMDVLSTVLNEVPRVAPPPEYGMSEVEHMVLCLRDVAEIVWKLTQEDHAPVIYLTKAYKYCRSYPYRFRSADRGGIFIRRLEILREAGKNAEALKEAEALLASENAGVNPYAFRAAKFLAEDAAQNGDYRKGAELLKKAYGYYPKNAACEKDLAEAEGIKGAEERYLRYHALTAVKYNSWE